jgi:hypothetical protein
MLSRSKNQSAAVWAKVEWGYGGILVRDDTNAGWINYTVSRL